MIVHGGCMEVMAQIPSDTFASAVTDPPYHLTSIVKRFGATDAAPAKHGTDGLFARRSRGFMGQKWDGGDIAFRPELWAEVLRVMKPGAHLVAFGGSRTYHRMACAIEDAGFEVRDCILELLSADDMARAFLESLDADQAKAFERLLGSSQPIGSLEWIYGSGFPHSHNQNGRWEGWGTALKPAHEPIVLARKPLGEKSVAANLARWGLGRSTSTPAGFSDLNMWVRRWQAAGPPTSSTMGATRYWLHFRMPQVNWPAPAAAVRAGRTRTPMVRCAVGHPAPR